MWTDMLKAKFYLTIFLASSITVISCYGAQKPLQQLVNSATVNLIDIDHVMSTLPTWSYDFEQGWNAEHGKGEFTNKSLLAKKWRYSQMQSKEAGMVVEDPENKNNKVMRFYWQKNGGRKHDKNTQKKAHLYGEFGKDNRQEEVWSFRVYFPSSGMQSDKKSEIIVQWHGHPDEYEAYRNPPLALDNRRDKLTVTWLYDQRAVTPPGYNKWDKKTADLGPTPKDKWVHFVFHIKWDPNGAGALRVWRDNQLKLDKKNIAIGFNDAVGAYLGFGIYKFENTSQHNQRTILFDDVEQWVIN